MELVVGAVLEGKVTGIAKFGAFVFLPEVSKSGMVHISEVANSYVSDIHDFLKENDPVKVKVIGIDDSGKISLSIKKALPPAPPKVQPAAPAPKAVSAGDSFEDKLRRFMSDSESNASAIKHHEQRKSNSYKRGR